MVLGSGLAAVAAGVLLHKGGKQKQKRDAEQAARREEGLRQLGTVEELLGNISPQKGTAPARQSGARRRLRFPEERAKYADLREVYGAEWVDAAIFATESRRRFDLSLAEVRAKLAEGRRRGGGTPPRPLRHLDPLPLTRLRGASPSPPPPRAAKPRRGGGGGGKKPSPGNAAKRLAVATGSRARETEQRGEECTARPLPSPKLREMTLGTAGGGRRRPQQQQQRDSDGWLSDMASPVETARTRRAESTLSQVLLTPPGGGLTIPDPGPARKPPPPQHSPDALTTVVIPPDNLASALPLDERQQHPARAASVVSQRARQPSLEQHGAGLLGVAGKGGAASSRRRRSQAVPPWNHRVDTHGRAGGFDPYDLPFTHAEYMELICAFREIDTDKSGTLDWGEFCGVAHNAFGIENFEYEDYEKLESKSNGSVGFPEVVRLLYPQIPVQQLRSVIKQWGGPYDERDGYGGYWRDILTAQDQQDLVAMYNIYTQNQTVPLTFAALKACLPLVSTDDLRDVFNQHDVDGDGVLALDEFAELMNVIFASKSAKQSIRLFFQPDDLMRDL